MEGGGGRTLGRTLPLIATTYIRGLYEIHFCNTNIVYRGRIGTLVQRPRTGRSGRRCRTYGNGRADTGATFADSHSNPVGRCERACTGAIPDWELWHHNDNRSADCIPSLGTSGPTDEDRTGIAVPSLWAKRRQIAVEPGREYLLPGSAC